MRSLLLIATGLLVAAPAFAQSIQCEGVVEGPAGEVLATYDLDRDGKVQQQTVTILPERVDGEETDYFPRPRIMLDYRVDASGQLDGPRSAAVVISRYSAVGAGKAPPLSSVQVKVSAPANDALTWIASEPKSGEAKFATLMRDTRPVKLRVELTAKSGGKLLASSEFDLSKAADFAALAMRARADGQRRVAAFQKLAGEGKNPDRCPS